MVRIKINKEIRELPTSWEDLTFEQVEQLENVNDLSTIGKILTGLDFVNFCQIIDYFDFIKKPLDLTEVVKTEFLHLKNGEILPCVDIGKMSFKKKIQFTRLVKEKNIIKTARGILENYFERDFKDEYFLRNFGIVLNLLEQLKQKNIAELNLPSSRPTSEMILAGIEKFNVLEEGNVINNICRNFPAYKHNEVEELEYDFVFFLMWENALKNEYEKKYYEIMKNKK